MRNLVGLTMLCIVCIAPTAQAVVYCQTVGIPKGCVARPVNVDPGINQPGAVGNVGMPRRGVGAPGVGVVDPGINQPGAVGNVGTPRPGVGAPGVGVADPGINQPGVAGNIGNPANLGGPVNRPGMR